MNRPRGCLKRLNDSNDTITLNYAYTFNSRALKKIENTTSRPNIVKPVTLLCIQWIEDQTKHNDLHRMHEALLLCRSAMLTQAWKTL